MKKIAYSLAFRSNPMRPDEDKKVYATFQQTDTVSIDTLARHIATHGCTYDRGDVLAIIAKLADCTQELLLDGYRVQLGDLGFLKPSIQCDGANSMDEFSAKNIKKLNINFQIGDMFKNLADKAEFEPVATRAAQAATLAAQKAGLTTVNIGPAGSGGEGSSDSSDNISGD